MSLRSALAFAALLGLLGLLCAPASAAGLQRLELPAGDGSTTLKGAVWHPCARPTATVTLRDVEIAGVLDCPVAGENLPLIVISHGARGWFGGHHDTAAALADAGFVVAAITHPDRGRRQWRAGRPAAIKRLIDHMLQDWPDHDRLDPARIGFFGFSRGGYTGLVLLGGRPSFQRLLWHCLIAWSDPICSAPPERSGDAAANDVAPSDDPGDAPLARDPRIKAAVIAAPLGMVFSSAGLAEATAPIQLWRAERDQLLLYPNHVEAVRQALPSAPDYRVVEGAGHFAFLAPCGEVQRARAPAICDDAAGFDRVAFHESFNAEVTAYFLSALGGG